MTPACAKGLGQPLLCMAKVVPRLLMTCGLLNRVQVRALNVLYDCNFKNFGIVEFPNKNRNFVQLGHLSGAPTSFTRHNLKSPIGARLWPHDQWLDDALFFDGRCEVIKFFWVKTSARLIRIR